MKILKRSIAAILLLALCFGMIACGKQETETKKKNKEKSTASTTEATKAQNTNNPSSEGTKEEQRDNTVYLPSKITETLNRDDGSRVERVYTAEYDEFGRPLLYKSTYAGTDERSMEFQYNDRSMLESEKLILHNFRNPVTGKLGALTVRKYSYDTEGNMIKREYHEQVIDGTSEYYEYTYNKSANTVEMYLRGEDGNLRLMQFECYNESKQLVTIETYQENGTLDEKTVYSYDSKGNILSWETTNKDEKTVCSYDSKGNILSRERTKNDGKLLNLNEYEYTYEEDKMVKVKCISKWHEYIKTEKNELYSDEPHVTVSEYEYTYDRKGNLVKKISVEKNDRAFGDSMDSETTCEWTYEYDANGNLLTETMSEVERRKNGTVNTDGYTRKYSYVAFTSVQAPIGDVPELVDALDQLTDY